MAKKFFSVIDSDGSPNFTPISQAGGSGSPKWVGVTWSEDEAEIAKLKEWGKTELTEAQYNDALKKKAPQQPLGDFRLITTDQGVLPVAQKAEDKSAAPATPSPEHVKVEQVIAPAPIPARRKSTVTGS